MSGGQHTRYVREEQVRSLPGAPGLLAQVARRDHEGPQPQALLARMHCCSHSARFLAPGRARAPPGPPHGPPVPVRRAQSTAHCSSCAQPRRPAPAHARCAGATCAVQTPRCSSMATSSARPPAGASHSSSVTWARGPLASPTLAAPQQGVRQCGWAHKQDNSPARAVAAHGAAVLRPCTCPAKLRVASGCLHSVRAGRTSGET